MFGRPVVLAIRHCRTPTPTPLHIPPYPREELDIDIADIFYKVRSVMLPPIYGLDREKLRDNPDFWCVCGRDTGAVWCRRVLRRRHAPAEPWCPLLRQGPAAGRRAFCDDLSLRSISCTSPGRGQESGRGIRAPAVSSRPNLPRWSPGSLPSGCAAPFSSLCLRGSWAATPTSARSVCLGRPLQNRAR